MAGKGGYRAGAGRPKELIGRYLPTSGVPQKIELPSTIISEIDETGAETQRELTTKKELADYTRQLCHIYAPGAIRLIYDTMMDLEEKKPLRIECAKTIMERVVPALKSVELKTDADKVKIFMEWIGNGNGRTEDQDQISAPSSPVADPQ